MFYVVYDDGLIYTVTRTPARLAKSLQQKVISEADLLNSDMDRLLQIYNRNAEIQVKDFPSIEEARARVASLLESHFKLKEIPTMAKRNAPADTSNDTATTETTAAAAPAEGKASSSRTPKSAVIRLKTDSNPKRVGSNAHARFALYRDGMTVEEFIKAGGTMGDINFDQGKGFIALEGVEAPAAPAATEAPAEQAQEAAA